MKLQAMIGILLCILVSAVTPAQAGAQQAAKDMRAPYIPGVVAGGTKVELIWTGSQSADGIISASDGGLLYAEEPASRISKLDRDNKVSVVMENTNGAGALAIDSKGRMFAAQRHDISIGILSPERRVLANNYEGDHLKGANDLVVDKKGGVYFTESGRMPPAVYYINAAGKITRLAADLRANGIMLSRDEKTLFVTNSEYVVAFDVRQDGTVANRRNFGKLHGAGADGLAIDSEGRLYCASPLGVQVFAPHGALLGVIPTPRPSTSVAFAGRDKKTLYITARGANGPGGDQPNARSIYKISMRAQGFRGRVK